MSNPLLYKISTPFTFRFPAAGDVRFSGEEKLILFAVISSVCLDILTNIFNPNPAVAPLKGLVLIVVVSGFRTLRSYLTTLVFIGVFGFRELDIILFRNDLDLKSDVVYFLRILFFITWCLLFYEKRNDAKLLRYVLSFSVGTTVLSVMSQIAGFAFGIDFFRAYRDAGRSGYKGLFLAENDTSVFYLITLIYALFLWRSGKRLYTVVVLTGLVFLGFGSKTALFGAVLVPIVYFFFSHPLRSPLSFWRLAIRPRLAFWWGSAILFAAACCYLAFYHLYEALSFIKYDQLLRVYEESGLLSSLLSFRDHKVIGYFHSIRSLPDLLFGLQLQGRPEGFEIEDPANFMYEIDIFDYLARVGIIGSSLTLGLVWLAAGLKHWRSRTPELKTLIVMIFLLGCTVGHTLISSMNGLWIGFLLTVFGSDLVATKGISQNIVTVARFRD